MKLARIIFGLICFLLLAGQVWSMSRWTEARGVYDDVCYLRQAHLFQRFGLGGFDTDLSRDDDRYLADKLREIGAPADRPPCHTPMPAAGKLVIQYPPGTGLLLALFPQGHQVVPLFVSATVVVFGFALLGIWRARSVPAIILATVFGCLAVYIMINPVKASYSMAPTMMACALAGWLTARWAAPSRNQIRLALLLGFVLGCSVNFRLPNLFLAAGYFLFFLGDIVIHRKLATVMHAVGFGAAFVIGMAPTLLSNAINAGSPFTTTYGGPDVGPLAFSLDVIRLYVTDMQFVLLVLAAVSVVYLLARGSGGVRRVAVVIAINLAVNLAFFFSHPLVTPYYTIPISMLSLWSLSFAAWTTSPEAVRRSAAGQTANAWS